SGENLGQEPITSGSNEFDESPVEEIQTTTAGEQEKTALQTNPAADSLSNSGRQPDPIGETTDDPQKAAGIGRIDAPQPSELQVERGDEPECASCGSRVIPLL